MAFLKKSKKDRVNDKKRRQGSAARSLYELTIDDLLHGPEGVGRVDGRAVFVARSVPGDRLKIQVTERKKSFWRADIVNVLEASPDRRKAPCHVFGRCGGCQWLHVDYERQLVAKQRNVTEALRRLGGLDTAAVDVQPIVPSPRKYHYRRRARLQCRVIAPGTLAVGFKAAATHRVVSHDDCWLYAPTIRKVLLTMGRRLGRALVDARFQCHGACTGPEGAEHTSLSIDVYDQALVAPLTDALTATAERLPLRWSVAHKDSLTRVTSAEPPVVTFEVPGVDGTALTLRAAGDAFFQANLEGNADLVRTVLDWAGPVAGTTVLDLYSGVGNFAVPLAAASATVTAVELDPTCARLAMDNAMAAAAAGTATPVEVVQAPAADAVADLVRRERRFDLAVVDPPRGGARDVVPGLLELRPARILCVSCDPATLARDLRELVDGGYRLTRLRPFDLFPQTYHVEIVAELAASAPEAP